MIFNWEQFLEANINLQTLNKSILDKKTGDILVYKLINKIPINFNGKEHIVTKMLLDNTWVDIENVLPYFTINNEWDSTLANNYFKIRNRYKKVFMTEDDSEFRLNDIYKTSEFGSKGPGKNIKLFESIQSLFLLLRQYNNFNITTDNYNELIDKYLNGEINGLYTDVNLTRDNINQYIGDRDWLATFIKVSNRIFNKINSNIEYEFYHVSSKDIDSPFVQLNKMYKQFSKVEKFSINFSKFNPADVYMISKKEKKLILELINNTNKLDELINVIDNLFLNNKLISISLKKIGENDNFKLIVNKDRNMELPNFEISSFIINKYMDKGISSKISTKSFWKNKYDKNVDKTGRMITIDSSNTDKKQNVDGEVEGKRSRHGKISFRTIYNILSDYENDYNISSIVQDYSYINNKYIDDNRITGKEKLLNEIEYITNKILNLELPENYLIFKDFIGSKDISNSKNKLISRLQSLQIIYAIGIIYSDTKEMDEEGKWKSPVADDIITRILRYALSIKTDKFISPMYLRVL